MKKLVKVSLGCGFILIGLLLLRKDTTKDSSFGAFIGFDHPYDNNPPIKRKISKEETPLYWYRYAHSGE
jgi:hypothetical protein